ncbi:hypothetical protein [Mycobacterium sp. pR1184]|uniref:hypothetical protein n=1 Tax=Mycobacterium sp. pR1184 TaxID=3238981 RepID=UPI00351BACAB
MSALLHVGQLQRQVISVNDNSAENSPDPDPARRRPDVPDVPRKVSPAKVAGGGGLFLLGALIVYVALHWDSWIHPRNPVPTFPSVHVSIPSTFPTTVR